MTPAGAWTKAFAALLAALIVIPVLAVVPLAFSEESFLVCRRRTGRCAGGAPSSPMRPGCARC